MIPGDLARVLVTVSSRHRQLTRLRLLIQSFVAAWMATTLYRTAAHLFWSDPTLSTLLAVFFLTALAVYVLRAEAPLDTLSTARLIDRRLSLKDRLATAVEHADSPSELAEWLKSDANQQARFVDPKAVVPLPKRLGWKEGSVIIMLAVSVLLWTAPLPSGLMAGGGKLAPLDSQAAPEEGDIYNQAAELRKKIASSTSAQMKRLDRQLADLQAGLRDRSLPKDEALALLRYLERRANMGSEREAQALSARPNDSTADLDRIQELANRLRAVKENLQKRNPASSRQAVNALRQLQSGQGGTPADPQMQEALNQLMQGDDAQAIESLNEAIQQLQASSTNGASRSGEDEQTRSGGDNEAGRQAARPDGATRETPQDGAPAGRSGATDGAEQAVSDQVGSGTPSAGNAAPDGTGQEGSTSGGSRPGTAKGADVQGALPNRATERELQYVHDDIGAGPLRKGTVQTTFGETSLPPAGSLSLSDGALSLNAGARAEAVEREEIPLAYRESIKRYFNDLEPDN